MRKTVRFLLPSIALIAGVILIVALVTAPTVSAKGKPGGGGSECPRTGIACADVYDPVICSDGHVYGNACYAYVACATGCVSTGGGPQS